MRDVEAYWRLITLLGEEAVPCLVVDGDPLAGSSDIVSWLEAHSVPARAGTR